MGDLQAFLADYQSSCIIPDLPESIKNCYSINSCLKHNAHQQVYLLKSKEDETACILKVAPNASMSKLKREHMLLQKLHDSAFPHPIACFAQEEHAFLLREYIPGWSLADYKENSEAIPHKKMLTIACNVCDIVEKLHAMEPPIIHRDIKPQNIIITESGTIHLVDLDTVQIHSPQKSYDTEVLGTAITAAPEQFGYKRSDVQADVYGIGMLLVFLLTGTYEIDQLRRMHVSPILKRIIYKCLRFDPQKRYSSVRHLHKRLSAYSTRLRNMAISLVCITLICLMATGIYINRTGILQAMGTFLQQMNRSSYQFKSPIIEKAVRLQLGRAEGEISLDELQAVTELNICGDTPYPKWEDASSYGFTLHLFGTKFEGGYSILSDLSDLVYMPNLKKLSLIRLNLTDISPIAYLPLTHFSICDNRITDIKPILTKMKSLKYLDISNNPISNISGIAELTTLDTLNISSTLVKDLDPIAGTNLHTLWCYVMPTDTDYLPLVTMTQLHDFGSRDLSAEAVRILSKVESLRNLLLFFCKVDSLEPLLNLKDLNFLSLHGSNLTNLEGISLFNKLQYLDVKENSINDLSALIGHPSIEQLVICDNPVHDLSPLIQMPALTTVTLSRDQEALFSDPVDELPFTVQYNN